MRLVVALTGGIGSGKSTVADVFAVLGAAVVDTDVIAHELTAAQGRAIPEIAAAFGCDVLRPDGALDRAAMRHLVFSNASVKDRLEAILHPMIRRESEAQCQNATAAPYVLLVVPLFVENAGYRQLADRVLVVDCDESAQLARVAARSGFSADEIRAIMATQASRAERLAVADDVIENDDGRDSLDARVAKLHQHYLALAAGKGDGNVLQASC